MTTKEKLNFCWVQFNEDLTGEIRNKNKSKKTITEAIIRIKTNMKVF